MVPIMINIFSFMIVAPIIYYKLIIELALTMVTLL